MTSEQDKQTQPDIGWCPCCNRAVIELPQGYCSNCFNHTTHVMNSYDHQLIIDSKDKEIEELRRKLLSETRSSAVPEGIPEILNEAANVLEAVATMQFTPSMLRLPIVDELHGFALILSAAPKE